MIPLAKPYIDDEDIKGVVDVLLSGRLSRGPKVKEFEKNFAEKIGTKYAIAVNSGTSALHLCLKSLGIGKGDEVITSPFSFIASANSILFEGAKPVFVDIEEDTYNMNPDLIEEKITKRTKAILPVHIFGQSCKMDKIMQIAKKHKLYVIEDACESILAKYKGKNVGIFGDASVFSFFPNKQITTGEGGIILTNNKEIAELCRSYRNQGRDINSDWLEHVRIGYNYRMDEMSASLGVTQLKKINEIILKRRIVAREYINQLLWTEGIILPKEYVYNKHTWFVFVVRVKERDKVMKKLEAKGIPTRVYFPSIHKQIFYDKGEEFPVSEKVSKEALALPFYTAMTDEEIFKVCDALREAIR